MMLMMTTLTIAVATMMGAVGRCRVPTGRPPPAARSADPTVSLYPSVLGRLILSPAASLALALLWLLRLAD